MSSPLSFQEQVVTISYQDLIRFAEDEEAAKAGAYDNKLTTDTAEIIENQTITLALLDKIGQAFGDGAECLGILAITDIPNFEEKRTALLPLSQQLATLPLNQLDQVTSKQSAYQVGWSHGKEKVQGDDKFDTCKGSYYANPLHDNVVHLVNTAGNTVYSSQVVEKNPAFFAPNIWPHESIPSLEPAFKDLGQLVCRVGRLLARPCDAYVARKCKGYRSGKLFSVINDSKFCKARLLHYFAMDNTTPVAKDINENDSPTTTTAANNGNNHDDIGFSDWCGWHNDHGSLTGLVPAMFLDVNGMEIICPDKQAGLYVKARNGRTVHVVMPPGSLGFQIGETSQLHTGGVLQATPHSVRGLRANCGGGGITREAFAVFMEPDFFGDMDIHVEGRTVQDIQCQEAEQHLPKSVRTLQSRWKPGMNLGEFSDATFAAFY